MKYINMVDTTMEKTLKAKAGTFEARILEVKTRTFEIKAEDKKIGPLGSLRLRNLN